MITKDSNGVVLENGDTVILTRDLDVKGVAISMKRGDKLKKIRTGDDPELVECKIGKKGVYIKTCFVKKI
ncbi:TPA: PhnA protein [Candidatus Peregrinibacteria bacterium]|nr:PhnA protein [Candidatus Peregrinibacteria bacterium]